MLLFMGREVSAANLPRPTTIGPDTLSYGLSSIGTFLIEAGMALGIIMIVYSGIRWMISGGDSKGTGDAKGILRSSIIGIAVILGVGLIIKTAISLITGCFFNC